METRYLISLLLVDALLVPWTQLSHAAPNTKVTYIANSSSSCAKPRGVRLTVRSYFDITNSSDGFSDNGVEIYGNVGFSGQSVWNVARQNALNASDGGRGIYLRLHTKEVIFDKPSTWNLIVTGFMNDRDKGSSDDRMWNPMKMPRVVNIKELGERYKQRRDSIFTLRGDQDSENADLVFSISKAEDIF